MMKTGMFSLLLLTPLLLLAERQSFDRYQSIIDRQMFGAVPPDFDPEKMPSEVAKTSAKGAEALTKEQEQIKSAIRFTSINVIPSGETAVGFVDNSDPKVPRHYYLKVGETRDGWELKEADAEQATMTIAKGEVTVSLALGGDSSKNATATSKTGLPGRSNGGTPAVGSGPLFNRAGGRPRMKRSEMAAHIEAMERERKENAAKAAENEAQREEEREAMRSQLTAIQDELRKTREQNEKSRAEDKDSPALGDDPPAN